jgi:eukaryotic-like serine/threonine-protein kinase
MQYLGSGAKSTIWNIRESRTGTLYVLKRVVKQHPSDDRFLEQARNEHAVAVQLNHPNLRRSVQLIQVRRWLRLHEIRLIMEYCPGLSVQQDRPTDVPKVLDIFIRVADALNYMHRSGFLHTDMKPNNIIVSPEGEVKVIDLGHSCQVGTVKDRIQGTPDYIAPEQVNRRPLDARTDVFNFGASLYWTLTGQAINTVIPKRSDSIVLKSELDLKPVTDLNPQVPPALASLVADCVAFNPTQRPPSMQPVQTKLELIRTQYRRRGEGVAGDESPVPSPPEGPR